MASETHIELILSIEVEQAFITLAPFAETQTLVTFGKFNAPFGIEPRDFWDQLAGSASLLFRASPRDLVGLMITEPLNNTGLTLRPFVVNGFDDDLDINDHPSVGLMVEYAPNPDVAIAVTNWYMKMRKLNLPVVEDGHPALNPPPDGSDAPAQDESEGGESGSAPES